MNLDQFYKYCNFLINKDVKGNFVDPSDFNVLINAINIEFYENLYDKFVQLLHNKQMEPLKALTEVYPLNLFIQQYNGQTSAGIFTLPENYKYFLSCHIIENGNYINVDEVNNPEFNIARGNMLKIPLEEEAICSRKGGVMYVLPTDIGATNKSLFMDFLGMPETPYYDYCKDSNDNILYMPDDYYIQKVGSLYNLYDELNTLIEEDVLYFNQDLTTLPVNSLTVEFEWPDDLHHKLALLLVEKMGVSVSDNEVQQYSQFKNKENA